jgi:ATP-dependent Zn protease
LLYVPLPDSAGRASIMRTLVQNVPIGVGVDVGAIGGSNQCEGFSGADLALLVSKYG